MRLNHLVRARYLLLFVTILCFLTVEYLPPQFGRLVTTQAPLGIVSLQRAFRPATAQGILESWGQQGRRAARISLLLDLPLIASYTLCLIAWVLRTSSLTAGSRLWSPSLGGLALSTAVMGAIADLGEDALHAWMLNSFDHSQQFAPGLPLCASLCALIKFSLLGLGGLYVFAGQIRAWSQARRVAS